MKRSLPLKSTVKSRVIRLNNGIDTREHIADFDSATDHVMTLKKFQHLNVAIEHPTGGGGDQPRGAKGVFVSSRDNTTNISATAPGSTTYTGVWPNVEPATLSNRLPRPIRRKLEEVEAIQRQDPSARRPFNTTSEPNTSLDQLQRWRYDGPSLVQMSGLEFDRFLKSLDSTKRTAFRDVVKKSLIEERIAEGKAKARDTGMVGEVDLSALGTITDEEVSDHIRKLRQLPSRFGPLIAGFLDLPDGPNIKNKPETWTYRANTVAAPYYESAGPPRTHPSAGLSYIHSHKYARNSSMFGPRHEREPEVARLVKIKTKGIKNVGNLGIAGFIVKEPHTAMKGIGADFVPAFAPSDGGLKRPVSLTSVEVSESGAVQMATKPVTGYVVQDNTAIHSSMTKDDKPQRSARQNSRIMPSLARDGSNYRRREPLKQDEDVDSLFAEFTNTLNSR